MKVNDYVRTKCGEIAKIDKCLGKDGVYKNMQHYETDRMVTKFNNFILYEEDIIKSSPNIIDLIEVGDYVNGKQVYESRYHELYISYVYCGGIGVRTTECYATFINDMKEDDIESIVTKEQFESIKYKVKE